jgi:hypothetical protein
MTCELFGPTESTTLSVLKMILMMLCRANWPMLLKTSQSDAVFVTSSVFHLEPAPLSLLPPADSLCIIHRTSKIGRGTRSRSRFVQATS